MDLEKKNMAQNLEALKNEIVELRKNEERWSRRVTKLIEKNIDLEKQLKQNVPGHAPVEKQTAGTDIEQLEKAVATGRRRLLNLTKELSAPLMPVLELSGRMLKDVNLSSEQHLQLAEVHQSAKKVESILLHRQELVRWEDQTLCDESEWIELSGFLKELTVEFAEQAESKGLFFAFSRKGDLSGMCRLEGARIRRVLRTLFGRALVRTPDGRVGLQAVYEPLDEDQSTLSFLLMYSEADQDPAITDLLSNSTDPAEADTQLNEDELELDLLRKQAQLLGGRIDIENPSGRKMLLRFSLTVERRQDRSDMS